MRVVIRRDRPGGLRLIWSLPGPRLPKPVAGLPGREVAMAATAPAAARCLPLFTVRRAGMECSGRPGSRRCAARPLLLDLAGGPGLASLTACPGGCQRPPVAPLPAP
jgi:hypothetical protein